MITDQFTYTLVSWAVVHNTGKFSRVQTIVMMHIIVHQIVGITANFEPTVNSKGLYKDHGQCVIELLP